MITTTPDIDAARRLLGERLGFDAFRGGQEAVISHLLAGRSAAAVFPTGGGKSLCYQLPALLLPGVTLVVSPLIALMKDQIDALAARGVRAHRLDSSLSADEYRAVMDDVRERRVPILYVAPERFHNERFRAAIARVRVSLFAIDEAHCISEWGHNFRPDYLKLARVARALEAERVLALTATATERVLGDICRELAIDPACAVRTGFHRENLTLLTSALAPERRDAALLERLRTRPPGPTIVYVTLQRTAEEVAARLAAAGIDAHAYHAGMRDDDRVRVQERFMASDRAVVVATIAFGMGVDKADIRYVYHVNPPKSLESYSQEIGRAGRDGAPATCEMLLSGGDWNVLESFAYGDTPSRESVASFVADVFSPERADPIALALSELAAEHDIRDLVVKTLLTYLELDGHLEAGTPFFAGYRFRLLVPEEAVFGAFDAERARFLRSVFDASKRGRTWITIDPAAVAERTGEPRDRIMRALDYLEGRAMIELQPQQMRHRFRRLGAPGDLDALAGTLHDRLLAREQAELDRLEKVRELLTLDACRTSALGAHFGEPLAEPCDRCSFCLGERASPEGSERQTAAAAADRRQLERAHPPIDDAVWERAQALRRRHPDALGDPRALARLLCGVSSPRLRRARVTSSPEGRALFGALDHVPFADILARAQVDATNR